MSYPKHIELTVTAINRFANLDLTAYRQNGEWLIQIPGRTLKDGLKTKEASLYLDGVHLGLKRGTTRNE